MLSPRPFWSSLRGTSSPPQSAYFWELRLSCCETQISAQQSPQLRVQFGRSKKVGRVLQKMRPSTASIQALIFALVVTEAASQVAGQAGTGQTVIQKATEQF